MVRDYILKLQAGEDVRKNLIALKAEAKEYAGKHAILLALNNQVDMFYGFLSDEDPKVRKNAALVLGQLGVQESLSHLYKAYEDENTMFVKSSYLTAMKELDYRDYLQKLKERLEKLQTVEVDESKKKHILEECKQLQELVLMMEGGKKHKFCGWNTNSKIILLTNRNFREITADKIKSHRPKLFNAGVQAETTDLKEIMEVRTFSELLFRVDGLATIKRDGNTSLDEQAKKVAKCLSDSSLVSYLEERHEGEAPFYFRIECKSKMDLKQKSTFTKKLGAYLQEFSQGKLINSTSHYEVELRLIENNSGDFVFLLKLYTLADDRFAYRVEALPTSIAPVNAALTMELAKEYLREGAQVLDPFCGAGTMLIERNRFLPTGDKYGVDIYGQGIEAARINTKEAHVRANYINRDFFDFKHEYLFDEIISNLPRVTGGKNAKEIETLYRSFWKKIPSHLNKDAKIILYCYDKEILMNTLPRDKFEILEEFEISKKEGSYVFVIRERK